MEVEFDEKANQVRQPSHLLVITIPFIIVLCSTVSIILLSWQKQKLSQQLSINQSIRGTPITIPSVNPTPDDSGINYSYIHTTYDLQTLVEKKYQDDTITFNIPLEWKVYGNRQFGAPYIINVDFADICSRGNISFSYKYTNLNDPNTYTLAQANPYGPTEQTTEIVTINGLQMGINNQVTGDGSGGYEPKIVVDFLSKSKKFHYYFRAYMGCSKSHEETYEKDLLPLLNSLILNE